MKFRMIAAVAALALVPVGQAFAQASCELGEPAADMPEEFSQFAFIIGDFEVQFRKMTENGWSEPGGGSARWNGRYSMDGKSIMDWWYGPGSNGVNVRLFDPSDSTWKTAWHSSGNYEVRELHQRIWKEDGKLHLWQVYPATEERNVYFESYENGRWARITQKKNDETGEWTPDLMIEAIPAECATRH